MTVFRPVRGRPDFDAATHSASARHASAGASRQVAIMAELMTPGWFSNDPIADARGCAVLALGNQTGAPRRTISALRRRDWRPDRRDVVDLAPEGVYAGRWPECRGRVHALTATAIVVVEHYLALSPPAGEDDWLIRTVDGGHMRHETLGPPLARALAHLGEPGAVSHGVAGLIYRRALLGAGRADGLPQYLIGHGRWNHVGSRFTYDAPPDEVARDFLQDVVPLARPWEALVAAISPRAMRRSAVRTAVAAGRDPAP